MGDETAGAAPQVWLGRAKGPLDTRGKTYEDIVEEIGQHYELKNVDGLYSLAERLIEISVIDQATLQGADGPGARRRQARELALALRAKSEEVVIGLNQIEQLARRFVADTGWSPPLLEEVFGLEGLNEFGLSIIQLPEELSPINYVASRPSWSRDVKKTLVGLCKLPISASMPARMANRPIRNAVYACRYFWTVEERRDWKSFSLHQSEVRNNNSIADLKNDCEQFVANMLSACGIGFNLKELNSAWMALRPSQTM